MPTEAKSDEKFKESLKEKTVPLDTSGQGAEVTIPEEKDEAVVETKEPEPTVVMTDPEQEPEAKEYNLVYLN